MSWTLTVDQIIQATGGKLVSGKQGLKNCSVFTGIGTDTRSNLTGKLFIALRGDRFDAHDFLAQAVDQDVAGLIVDQACSSLEQANVVVIRVDDTLRALQNLALFWRRLNQYKVLAITGSNGKTSTKSFAATLLQSDFKTHASEGSFNNHWGVPLTLLSAQPGDEVVVAEMGMNHSGELARLVEIAEPNIDLCTMVGRAHIGELGSQAAIVEAKEEIYLHQHSDIQVFNLDNEWTLQMYERANNSGSGKRLVTFSSFREDADIQLRAESMAGFSLCLTGTIGGIKGNAVAPVFGRHNVTNIMAAAALAWAAGVTEEKIWQSISNCRGAWGRNQVLKHKSGATILFDAYNANPDSMAASLRSLFELDTQGKKYAVLADMFELGEQASLAHRELGEMAGQMSLADVWFIGEHGDDFKQGFESADSTNSLKISDIYKEELALDMASMLNPHDVVVVKGSRAMKLERVVQAWGCL